MRRSLDMQETLIQKELKTKGRAIVARTRGSSHSPITRLVSPSDLGEAMKPFVFLDYFDIDPKRMPPIGFHPHSGIETVTVVLQGQLSYQETSGTEGVIDEGGVEWMHAGGGVWHSGGRVGAARIKGYQLWIALPPLILQRAHPDDVGLVKDALERAAHGGSDF